MPLGINELDRVIEWDAHLIDDAELLKEQTEALLANIDNGQPFKGNMRTIEQAVDDLINTYRERDNIMKNLNEED